MLISREPVDVAAAKLVKIAANGFSSCLASSVISSA